MSDERLQITAQCKDNPDCLYQGEEMFLDIVVTNVGPSPVDFPLAYVQDRGPIVRLVDKATAKDSYLKPNVADESLMAEFKTIPPGDSETVIWVIKTEELEQFGGDFVDVLVEITIMTTIRVNDEPEPFRGTGTMNIVSKDKPASAGQ